MPTHMIKASAGSKGLPLGFGSYGICPLPPASEAARGACLPATRYQPRSHAAHVLPTMPKATEGARGCPTAARHQSKVLPPPAPVQKSKNASCQSTSTKSFCEVLLRSHLRLNNRLRPHRHTTCWGPY